ncbi:hypothetical protein TNCT_317641 [Trichonephila clavata]|uniref:Uncharacterized protein n=1 Tax=Trichonephila clavata TaxID=2740835 RepID=A0A8X6HIB5_TRICU|nr:hypothetical protein TNCT_317641 [Trichonephila clavata]
MSSFYVDNCLASVQTQSELDRFIDVAMEIMAERKFDLRRWEHSIPSDPVASPTNVLGMIWDRHCDNLSLNIPHLRELMGEASGKDSLPVEKTPVNHLLTMFRIHQLIIFPILLWKVLIVLRRNPLPKPDWEGP